jgi:hypothetical protein
MRAKVVTLCCAFSKMKPCGGQDCSERSQARRRKTRTDGTSRCFEDVASKIGLWRVLTSQQCIHRSLATWTTRRLGRGGWCWGLAAFSAQIRADNAEPSLLGESTQLVWQASTCHPACLSRWSTRLRAISSGEITFSLEWPHYDLRSCPYVVSQCYSSFLIAPPQMPQLPP